METLIEKLSKHLPKDKEYKLFHVRTQTIETKSLIQYEKGNRPNYNLKAKHYLTISDEESLIIFGIEINVYLIVFNELVDRYIFVSKCDTTGFPKQFKITNLVSEYLNWLVNLDIKCYCDDIKFKTNLIQTNTDNDNKNIFESNNQTINSIYKLISCIRENPNYFKNMKYYSNGEVKNNSVKGNSIVLPPIENTKVSFFTRASDQYLFPNSSKNTNKHIVDGKQLLNWWINVLHKALDDDSWKCNLAIPGSDDEATLRFINTKPKWRVGNIHVSNKNNNRAIANIPLFPDDPKGRFLEHLVVEGRYKSVSLNQFWQELGFRQEFRLGNIVGIIGCELKNRKCNNLYQIDDSCLKVNMKQYKKIQTLIKNEDFNIPADISNLTISKIPQLLRNFNIHTPYRQLKGKCEVIPVSQHSSNPKTTNYVSNQARRKGPTNDLSSLIKRKKPNDLTSLVKRKS